MQKASDVPAVFRPVVKRYNNGMSTTTPQKPETEAPLTAPADLLALAGRFFGTVILTFISIMCLIRHEYGAVIGTMAGALFLQWMTVRMWRRLRDERIAAKEARGIPIGVEVKP